MENLVFSLINNRIFNSLEKLPEGIHENRLKDLYSLSKKHDITPIVADELEKNGLLNGQIGQLFKKEKMVAIYRREQQNFEIERISRIFERESIPFILLKGSVIKNFYPFDWLRTSADIDILINETHLEKANELLKQELNYEFQFESRHDCSYMSKSGVQLELHFKIKTQFDEMNKVFDNIWDYANPKEEGLNEHILKGEFILFYIVAHGKYHFAFGGCGIRPFIDYRLLKNKIDYSPEAFNKLIAESDCIDFLDGMEKLCKIWFDKLGFDDFTKNMSDFIINGGVFGTKSSFGDAERYLRGNKFKYYLSRIFISRERINAMYPKSKKYPVLIPFYQVKRWFRLFDKGVSESVKQELNSNSDQKEIETMMKQLGF